MKKFKCPNCGGTGTISREVVVGEITHEMAIDAGDINFEGQLVTEIEESQCPTCDGMEKIDKEEMDFLNSLGKEEFPESDEIPF